MWRACFLHVLPDGWLFFCSPERAAQTELSVKWRAREIGIGVGTKADRLGAANDQLFGDIKEQLVVGWGEKWIDLWQRLLFAT